jgi:hypothetical protein
MNSQFGDDDPELRALLDSIGLEPIGRTPAALDPGERAAAERMLAHVRAARAAENTSPAPRPRWRPATVRSATLAGLACLAVGVALVVAPWNGGRPAAAVMTAPPP